MTDFGFGEMMCWAGSTIHECVALDASSDTDDNSVDDPSLLVSVPANGPIYSGVSAGRLKSHYCYLTRIRVRLHVPATIRVLESPNSQHNTCSVASGPSLACPPSGHKPSLDFLSSDLYAH